MPIPLLLVPLALDPALQDGPAAPDPAGITLERIMSDPEWIGRPPERPFWLPDGSAVGFWREREGSDVEDLWLVGLEADAEPRALSPEEMARVPSPRGDWNAQRDRYAYERGGDLFVREPATGKTRALTRTSDVERAPFFLVDGRSVAFEREGGFYAFDAESGVLAQLADLRAEDDPDAEDEEDFDYLEARQKRLYQALAEKAAREEEEEAREDELREADPMRAPLPWYLGDDVEVVERSLSPAGRWLLAATRPERGDEGKRDRLPAYVTESGYVEARDVRSRVGRDDPQGHSLLLLDLRERTMRELSLDALPGVETDPFADLRLEAVEWHVAHGAEREEVEEELAAPERRAVRVQDVEWSEDGERAAVRLDSVDNKDRWIVTVDLEEGRLVPQHRLTDPAWINWRFNEFGWLEDGETLWYLSEEDGFSQVWTKPLGGEPRRVTAGGFVVADPEISPDGRHLYFRANESDTAVWEVWRVEIATDRSERVTDLGGDNEFGLSPDGSRLWILHSEVDRHPDLFVQEAVPGARARRLTVTVGAEFAALPWIRPEIVDVPSSHVERPLRAKLHRPPGFDAGSGAARWPAVVFVHGAGYLQNVHAGWSHYFRETLFHTFLARNGYVVLDLDYRGSAGYGRDWRAAVYRRAGHPEIEDLRDAVEWLAAEMEVDRERVGVYGGSYGGFLAFMALFRDPDLFAAGAALRPVTDWANYNHGYTSNLLNTPEVDPMAYERSSPIEFAAGLTKPLLICAGMQDDNVFFQDTVLLVQRLIELEKRDFETAFYPLEGHAFERPESWLDEYRRVFELFERHLKP